MFWQNQKKEKEMNSLTLEQKLFLAKQVPDVVDFDEKMASRGMPDFRWKGTNNSDIYEDWFEVTDREWHYVVSLVEGKLARDGYMPQEWYDNIVSICGTNGKAMVASPSQRTEALQKVLK